MDLEVVHSEALQKSGIGECVRTQIEILHLIEKVDCQRHDSSFYANIDHGVVSNFIWGYCSNRDLVKDFLDGLDHRNYVLSALGNLVGKLQPLPFQNDIESDDVGFDLGQLIIDGVQKILGLLVVAVFQADVEEGVVGGDIGGQALFLHLLENDKWVEIWFVGKVFLDQDIIVVDGWDGLFWLGLLLDHHFDFGGLQFDHFLLGLGRFPLPGLGRFLHNIEVEISNQEEDYGYDFVGVLCELR